ncbi:MAG: nucleotidyltransferase domain-containing protein [Deltaproteobacteria bacterium]|nr:nucleotidyltransferase domain-containing protein [Deltaproteobacteria bacterium]
MEAREKVHVWAGDLPDTDAFKTEEISPEVIRVAVERIVRAFRPEMIYLFGSRARGESTQESDLDFLVVMESDRPRAERRGIVSNVVRPRFFPMDIVVYTPDEFKEAADHEDYWFNPFIKDIINEGIILYDRSA